ncbi:hypothetical protein T265_07492 [Opisthorchis viverrini]|uniref:Uncharacterized protein n=1 Tax=Opisthorchis viverrini TaxID=6198 RepID=A0A074ZH27_OPIVI|nr:hypothetical protein T265_07492 [Opisthorchis viverrini]KER24987.1 hypothetical protein T265_07492 [Opisthorchis viverrini]
MGVSLTDVHADLIAGFTKKQEREVNGWTLGCPLQSRRVFGVLLYRWYLGVPGEDDGMREMSPWPVHTVRPAILPRSDGIYFIPGIHEQP